MFAAKDKEITKTPFGTASDRSSLVQFKGRPGLLEILLDEDAPLAALLQELQRLLAQNNRFLSGNAIRLHFGMRPFDRIQIQEIQALLHTHGLRVTQVSVASEALEDFFETEFNLAFRILSPPPPSESFAPPLSPSLSLPLSLPPSFPLEPRPSSGISVASGLSNVSSSPPPPLSSPHRQPLQEPPTFAKAPLDPHVSPAFPQTSGLSKRPTSPAASEPSLRPASPAASEPSLRPASSLFSRLRQSAQRLLASEERESLRARLQGTPDQAGDTEDMIDIPGLKEMPLPSAHLGPLPELDTQPEPAPFGSLRAPLEMGPGRSLRPPRPLHKLIRTCRAGTFLDLEGDVLVFGDLNPGAEIRATGDILVFGSLRGLAHAGSQGDRAALILAFDLSPMQLRIADKFAIPPPHDPRQRTIQTEVAYLGTSQEIEVEPWSGRLPSALSLPREDV